MTETAEPIQEDRGTPVESPLTGLKAQLQRCTSTSEAAAVLNGPKALVACSIQDLPTCVYTHLASNTLNLSGTNKERAVRALLENPSCPDEAKFFILQITTNERIAILVVEWAVQHFGKIRAQEEVLKHLPTDPVAAEITRARVNPPAAEALQEWVYGD